MFLPFFTLFEIPFKLKVSNAQPIVPEVVQTKQAPNIKPLADMIGAAEADSLGGYNAANAGKPMDLGNNGLTAITGRTCEQVTLAEVKAWQRQGLLFAVGRYQMIPTTLQAAQRWAGLPDSAAFSPANQDLMLQALLQYKRPTVWLYLQGKASKAAALLAMAKEWAGVPRPDGYSHYHGDRAGNSANVTVAQAYEALAQATT